MHHIEFFRNGGNTSINNVQTARQAVHVIMDKAKWDETASIPDVIQGIDTEVVTEPGSIRRAAELLEPFRRDDAINETTTTE